MLMRLIDPLLSIIYPHGCWNCGRPVGQLADGPACRDCWTATRFFREGDLLCGKCGAFLAESIPGMGAECGQCQDHFYDLARAAGLYERALTSVVLKMKTAEYMPSTAREHFIAAYESLNIDAESVVVPVPLSKRRAVEREFNQAEVLAKIVSDHAGLTLDAHSLMRRRDTPMHRAAMDGKARAATVKNAFEVVRPSLIRGRSILLVDDLMTSGSTASQCAKALKKSGAEKVTVLTLARAAF